MIDQLNEKEDLLNTCNICESKAITLFLHMEPSNLYRCHECGLIFFNPLPPKVLLEEFYSSEEGYLPSIRDTMRTYKENYDNGRARFQNILDGISRYIDSPRNVLDIGCGYGFFLLYCKEKGLDAFGVEISKETSFLARERGLKVFTNSIHEVPLDEASFDIITSFHCLEHALDPKTEVARIASLCKKNGIFFLSVPNASSLVAQDSFSTWKWISWPNHLFYFSPENLRILLVRAGFEIVEIYSQVGDSDVNDDLRVLDKKIRLGSDDRDSVLRLLYSFNKGQELVIISRKR